MHPGDLLVLLLLGGLQFPHEVELQPLNSSQLLGKFGHLVLLPRTGFAILDLHLQPLLFEVVPVLLPQLKQLVLVPGLQHLNNRLVVLLHAQSPGLEQLYLSPQSSNGSSLLLDDRILPLLELLVVLGL